MKIVEKSKKVGKMVRFNEEMANYVEIQAELFGISQSGFVNMCVKGYRDQNTALAEMSKIQGYIDQMSKLQQKEDK